MKEKSYTAGLSLGDDQQRYRAALCFSYFDNAEIYARAVETLLPLELKQYEAFKAYRRKKSFVLGRYCAKKAVSALVGEEAFKSILIKRGVFNQPVTEFKNKKNIQVSITHCGDAGACIAFPEEVPMGIDIEKTDPGKISVLESQVTAKEKELAEVCPFSYCSALTLLWTAKEALSKVLKTGCTTPFSIFEINSITLKNSFVVSDFKNFAQYRGISFTLGSYHCTIVYPVNMTINLNTVQLEKEVFA